LGQCSSHGESTPRGNSAELNKFGMTQNTWYELVPTVLCARARSAERQGRLTALQLVACGSRPALPKRRPGRGPDRRPPGGSRLACCHEANGTRQSARAMSRRAGRTLCARKPLAADATPLQCSMTCIVPRHVLARILNFVHKAAVCRLPRNRSVAKSFVSQRITAAICSQRRQPQFAATFSR
jgi:hypothetical protein